MEFGVILLDTNAVISHLDRGNLTKILEKSRYAISTITIAELLRLNGLGEAEHEIIDEFIFSCLVVTVSEEIARKAAALGRTRKTKLPDLLIAATAIVLHATLLTNNTADFRRIPNLLLQKLPKT